MSGVQPADTSDYENKNDTTDLVRIEDSARSNSKPTSDIAERVNKVYKSLNIDKKT